MFLHLFDFKPVDLAYWQFSVQSFTHCSKSIRDIHSIWLKIFFLNLTEMLLVNVCFVYIRLKFSFILQVQLWRSQGSHGLETKIIRWLKQGEITIGAHAYPQRYQLLYYQKDVAAEFKTSKTEPTNHVHNLSSLVIICTTMLVAQGFTFSVVHFGGINT